MAYNSIIELLMTLKDEERKGKNTTRRLVLELPDCVDGRLGPTPSMGGVAIKNLPIKEIGTSLGMYSTLLGETTTMASQPEKLHFILFPLMAPGHMIPIIDMAKLLAQHRSTAVTIVSTPLNAARFKSGILRANTESGLDIRIIEFEFPYKEAGVPEGYENFDMLPKIEQGADIFSALTNLQPQLENYMETTKPRPSCIIADQLISCATEIARKFNIPRIVFHGPGCFPLLCSHYLRKHNVLENVSSDSEPFVVPGLPDKVEFTQCQLTLSSRGGADFLSNTPAAEKEAFGVVVNTFEELEGNYAKQYKNLKEIKTYFIGPVSLSNKDYLDKAERGNKTSIDETQCLKWLDTQTPDSVIYACLGTLCHSKSGQMMELGLALESSQKPFIWVIRENEESKQLKILMKENGFEARVQQRGILIWGWAPQVLILSHPSIGAFLTHCGWNSTLEGVAAGLPLITWPLFADQFYNEKLIVQVLGIGASVGAKVSTMWVPQNGDDESGGFVKRGDIEKAISCVMGGGDGGELRRKARELGKTARRAVEEGGSSYGYVKLLIDDVLQQTRHRLRRREN